MTHTLLRRPISDITRTRAALDSVVITSVHSLHQLDSYSCGAAAVATVITARTGELSASHWRTIARVTRPSPETGTPTSRVLAAVRAVGLGCKLVSKPIRSVARKIIASGDMIITTVRMPHQPADETHWVVIAGWSNSGLLVLNCTGLPLFSKLWYSWEELAQFSLQGDVVIRVNTELVDWVVDNTTRTRLKVS